MSNPPSKSSILEYAIKAKLLLQNDDIAPQIGINCLSNLRAKMRNMDPEEQIEILSYDSTDAAAVTLMEQYVSQPGIKINFHEFVLAHLNIFIDELRLVSTQP